MKAHKSGRIYTKNALTEITLRRSRSLTGQVVVRCGVAIVVPTFCRICSLSRATDTILPSSTCGFDHLPLNRCSTGCTGGCDTTDYMSWYCTRSETNGIACLPDVLRQSPTSLEQSYRNRDMSTGMSGNPCPIPLPNTRRVEVILFGVFEVVTDDGSGVTDSSCSTGNSRLARWGLP